MRPLLLLLLCCCGSSCLLAQPTVNFRAFAPTFRQPTDIVADPRVPDRLYVVEKRGSVQAFDTSSATVALWLDLTSEVDSRSEGGLLGMAFHPDPDSQYVYLNYTVPSPTTDNLLTTIARVPLDTEGQPLPQDRSVLLTIEQPANNHNAGDLAFGPDGYLYIPTGDGGGGGDPFRSGQDPQTLLGKLLRIDVDRRTEDRNYAIPDDNPFMGSTDTLNEIWALGLRNPWRISFDRLTGDLYIADVGQGDREEVNIQAGGAAGGSNYGWNCREGFLAFGSADRDRCVSDPDRYTDPALDYPHGGNGSINGASITGGYVYRGPSTNLQGYYIFGDFARQRLFFYRGDLPEAERLTVITDAPPRQISTFGEGNDGSLFVADFSGTIYGISGEVSTATVQVGEAYRLVAYPNPTTGAVVITLPSGFKPQTARVLDAAGRLVRTLPEVVTEGRQYRVELGGMAPGLYTIRLQSRREQAVVRIRLR